MPIKNARNKKARLETVLESLKKNLTRPSPPEQSGREPRDLNAYRERVKREIAQVEEKLKTIAG